jgi:hypothetical protein
VPIQLPEFERPSIEEQRKLISVQKGDGPIELLRFEAIMKSRNVSRSMR